MLRIQRASYRPKNALQTPNGAALTRALVLNDSRNACPGLAYRYHRNGDQSMSKITPFLWFNDNAEDAAEFYLSVFPQAKKLAELRSSGVGPWTAGKVATITIELMGQQMTFLNGGLAHALTPAFSYSIACKDQAEIDHYWEKLLAGGEPMACGWLTDSLACAGKSSRRRLARS
jgi:predicted 3-demethylubiquinone-9 3-methyltransferase (glyoxalase superfamily)